MGQVHDLPKWSHSVQSGALPGGKAEPRPLGSGGLLLLLLAIPLAAQNNPFTSAEDIAQGKRLFDTTCAGCHGLGGEGGRGPALNAGTLRSGSSDREVFLTVKNGVPNTEMPGSRQADPEIWKLVAYVRQLPRGSRPEAPSGDARAGQAVYAAQRCATCHIIQGEGGDLGPDLSRAGTRAARFLRDAIVNPGADVPLSYLAVSVTTAAGQAIRGLRLNEDDYSIQLRDASGNPRSFFKSGLKEFRHDKESLMPAYPTLSAADLDNLVAYLGSLK